MARAILSKYSNVVIAIVYALLIYYDYCISETYRLYPVPGIYLSKFAWLTMINLWSQCIYHAIMGILSLCKVRRSALNMGPLHFFATTIGFPLAFTVVLLFWGLYWIDPGTVLRNKEGRLVVSLKWYNHGLHTFPLIAMLIDFCIWRHHRPRRRGSLLAVAVFCLFYLIDLHITYYRYGFWAYPILANLSFPGRSLFLIFCFVFMVGAYIVGDTFNMFVHYIWQMRKKNAKDERNAINKWD